MVQHISQGEVILVVFPSCGIWTLGRGAGRGWAEARRPGTVLGCVASSQPHGLGGGHLPGGTCPLSSLSPQPQGLSVLLCGKS